MPDGKMWVFRLSNVGLVGLCIALQVRHEILDTRGGQEAIAGTYLAFAIGMGVTMQTQGPWGERLKRGLALGTLAIGSLLAFSLFKPPVAAHLASFATLGIVSLLLSLYANDGDPPSSTLRGP